MSAVEVNHISKSYGAVPALKDISFQVEKGEIFGIIGPDGAGKTSLFRILTTLLLPDKGDALITGSDIRKDWKAIRNKIGYMPGRFSLYQDMTVEENLHFFATLFKTSIKENYHLIKDIYIQIEPFKDRLAGNLSGGMKQKLALCCALIHKPEVLFLDEPTTGVDPVSRKELWNMLLSLKKEDISILVSTPYMEEASLCDTIGLIKEGQFMAMDTPLQITNSYSGTLWSAKAKNMHRLLTDLRRNAMVLSSFAFGEVHHITVKDELTQKDLYQWLEQKGNLDIEINPISPSIEDCYMKLATI